MLDSKALGVDGFNALFYKKYGDSFGNNNTELL